MTQKKENILNAALTLFSKNGYSAVSTSKIAKTAKVSEGLIFRHFGNKEGLLLAIMEMGKEKSLSIFESIVEIKNPKERLKAILAIPFSIEKSEHSFWKLLYQLKWQAETYDETMTLKLKEIITNTFQELNFEDPELEAELALILFDGMAASVLLKNFQNTQEIQTIVNKKYNL